MATEHEFPEWVDVQDEPEGTFWHDGTFSSKVVLTVLIVLTILAGLYFFFYACGHAGRAAGGWS